MNIFAIMKFDCALSLESYICAMKSLLRINDDTDDTSVKKSRNRG